MKEPPENGDNDDLVNAPEKARRFFKRRITRIISWITGLSLGAVVLLVFGILAAAAIFVRTETFQDGLRDRILKVARDELGADIRYDKATVSIFQREPKIEFTNVHLQPLKSKLGLDFKRIAVGISPFVSIPLLFFPELHLAYAEVEGLQYDLRSTKTLEDFINNIRPKKRFIPSTFQTSIERLVLKDVDVNLQLPADDVFKQSVFANLHLEQIVARIERDQIRYLGRLQFSNTQIGSRGPFSGSLSLEEGSSQGDKHRFKSLHLQIARDSSQLTDTFDLSGEVKRIADPIVDLKGELKANLKTYFDVDRVGGVVDSTFELRGPWQSMEGEGKIHLDGFHYDVKNFREVNGQWSLKNSRFDLKSLLFKEGEEELELKGTFPLRSNEPAEFQTTLKNIDFGSSIGIAAPPLVKWKGATSGTVKYSGILAPAMTGNFEWDLKILGLDIRTNLHETSIYQTPELSVSGKGTLSEITNGQFSSALSMAGSKWAGTGSWTHDEFDLKWDTNFSGTHVGDLFSRKLELTGNMKGSLKGPWKNLVMVVDQNISSFVMNGTKLSNLKGRLILSDRILFGAPLVTDELSLTGGIHFEKDHDKHDTFSDFRFNTKKLDVQFIFDIFKINSEFAKTTKGLATTQGFLKGPLDRPIGSGNLQIENWNIHNDTTKGRSAKAKWATAGGETYFDNIELRATQTSEPMRGEMSFDPEGLVDLSAEGRKIRIQDWLYLLDSNLGLQGLADFDLDYQKAAPSLKAKLHLFETSLAGGLQPESDVAVEWVADKLRAEGKIFGEELKISAEGEQTAKQREVRLKLNMQKFDVIPFFRMFQGSRLEVPLTGSGELTWTQPRSDCRGFLVCFWKETKSMSGGIKFDGASLQRGKVVLQEVDPFKIQITKADRELSKINLEKVTLRSNEHSLDIRGFFESANHYSISLKGKTELRSIASLYPQLSRSDGLADVDGVLDAQGFSGRIELTEGLLSFQNSPVVVRNVEARIRADNSAFELSHLSGEFKEGALSGKGRFKLQGSDFNSADIALHLENSLLQPQDGLSFRVAGPLNLHLNNEEARIDGKLQIREGIFKRRIDARIDVLKFLEPKRREFKTQDELENGKPWKLNVQLETAEPFSIRNNLAEGAANFNLAVLGTLKEPRLKGSVNLLRGQFRYNNREFEVRSGSIQFADQLSNVPTYDVRADTEINEYRVNIRLLGGPSEQKILYSSEPTLSEKDILSLISFGLPSSAPELSGKQGGTTRSTSLTGISYATGQLQDRIEGQLSSSLGIKRFHLLPAYFEKTEQTELQLTIGTDIIRDRLLVNYSTFLTAGQGGQQVELDLKLNRVMSLVGSWRDAGDGENDFGGDVRFRFEFE